MREKVTGARRWVVKIGSALLTGDGRGLDQAAMAVWVEQLAALRASGAQVVLVSSGAVAAGMSRLGWSERPKTTHDLQAAAAIGQMGLVQAWESSFQRHGLSTAQVLLTHDDLSDRKRYLNARSTLRALLDLGVIPVINENDTVITDEIRFGDNDTLGALVTNLVEADLLVILTDRDGLFTADPRSSPNAELVSSAMADDPELDAMAGGSAGALGRGGMATKLRAARLAARSGAATVIVGGRLERVIDRLHAGESLGTLLLSEKGMLVARKQWLAGHLQTRGRLLLDAGAVRALRSGKSSLLPVGVVGVEGGFRRGEMVVCVGPDGREVARGLANYAAQDAARIAGKSTDEIAGILGYIDDPEMVHKDNLVLV
ncbi:MULTISPECIES: glutamate 5-kinase [Pseudomonas]|jgi:glutamate 5-kinase|uniref:Glutamate 5-kinase n=1 Tax=Pseudomonas abyssi TaxID=170540 RepID=A0A2A3MLF7_9PSED|nr:glutamate 5-kinase [Pseudomonas abyssi]PBK05374.1 glutamate 5-kinase [Pseudomonas abyssi]|tara:strand:- start:376 stop:1494 length:1119 start_codon:yes stop_codon:yes gene_type:complete